MEKKNALVLYHADCVDGLLAATIVVGALRGDYDILAYKVQYDKESDNFVDAYCRVPRQDLVVVVDFSFSSDGIFSLREHHNNVLVLDHHKGSEHIKHITGCLHSDNTASGALMAIQYYGHIIRQTYGQNVFNQLMTAANLADDYDRYELNMLESPWFHAGFEINYVGNGTVPSAVWEEVLTEGDAFVNNIISRGYSVTLAHDQIVSEHVERAIKNPIACCDPKSLLPGIAIEVTTRSRAIINAIAHKYLERNPSCHYVLLWYFAEATRVSCSLRADVDNKAIDLNALTKHYGGGGHKTAAGMQLEPFQLFNWLDEVNVTRSIHLK